MDTGYLIGVGIVMSLALGFTCSLTPRLWVGRSVGFRIGLRYSCAILLPLAGWPLLQYGPSLPEGAGDAWIVGSILLELYLFARLARRLEFRKEKRSPSAAAAEVS